VGERERVEDVDSMEHYWNIIGAFPQYMTWQDEAHFAAICTPKAEPGLEVE
jgi:hypothetical protein